MHLSVALLKTIQVPIKDNSNTKPARTRIKIQRSLEQGFSMARTNISGTRHAADGSLTFNSRNESATNLPRVLHCPVLPEASFPSAQLRSDVTAVHQHQNTAHQPAAVSLFLLLLQTNQLPICYRLIQNYSCR